MLQLVEVLVDDQVENEDGKDIDGEEFSIEDVV